MPGALAAVGLAPVRPAWLVLWAARHARLAGFAIPPPARPCVAWVRVV